MTKIKIMDELLANKIAAGEVVEKCESVVKELVENSIDAGATEIKIELKESGIKEIKVTDNGFGMDREDAKMAFFRHATSKVLTEKDLFNISTLGFRGEALASIASVSKIELITSTGEVGTKIKLEGGKIIDISSSSSRKGTIIKINDLFFNTPARLKYVKNLYAELANITNLVNKIALSNPNIKISLFNNEKKLLQTDGSGDLLKVIMAVYGSEVASNMFEIEISDEDYEVSGFISKPEINRSSRNHMITIVNGRVVKNNEINKTINEAYHTYKPDNLFPIVILNIEVDSILIDVNIHPTKQDIKFSKMEELKLLIFKKIEEILGGKKFIPKVIKNDYVQETFDFSVNEKEEKIEKKEIELSNKDEENKEEKLPYLLAVASLFGTYIIAQNEVGMYLIDQHAAKERITYEFIKDDLGRPDTNTIELLIPITLEYTPSEFIVLKENFNLIKELGFSIEEFGINSIIVKSHPTWLPKNYEEKAIRRIFEIIIEKEKKFDIEKFNEKIAINLSCKLSIKANDNLSIEEMEHLINDLRKCKNPYNCPHGRPTIIVYEKEELEKMFKRSGF